MTTYQATLTINFGEVGFWNGKHPFRIRLDTGPLADLARVAGVSCGAGLGGTVSVPTPA